MKAWIMGILLMSMLTDVFANDSSAVWVDLAEDGIVSFWK